MIAWLAAAGSLALPAIATAIVLWRVTPPASWFDRVERAAAACGIGIGISSVPFFVWRLCGFGLPAYPAADVILWTLVAVTAAFAWRARPLEADPRPVPAPGPWAVAALAALAAVAAAVIALRLAHVPHGEWDAWAYWQVRASYLAAPTPAWINAFHPYTGADYPLMLPAAVARLWTMAGYSTGGPAAISVAFAAATVVIVTTSLWRTAGPAVAAAGAALVLAPDYLFHGTAQCADIPLGFFLILAATSLAAGPSRSHLTVAGLAAGLAAWTKNEGLVIAAAMPVLFIAFEWRRHGRRALESAWRIGAGLAPMAAVLLLYRLVIHPPSDLTAQMAAGEPMAKLLDFDRHRQVLAFLVSNTLSWGGWAVSSPVWAVAAWMAAAGFARERSAAAVPAVRATLAVMLAATYTVYVLTPYDLSWHLQTSWTRLVAQMWPALVWCALARPWPGETAVYSGNGGRQGASGDSGVPRVQNAGAPGEGRHGAQV